MKTVISAAGDNLLINGKLIYSDIKNSNQSVHGLLFNARFIQGIFDDKADPDRFARFGFSSWDPADQTRRLIEALPEWYSYGLRGFTVGLQGGGPCFTISNSSIDNNPFGSDGKQLDPNYTDRLDRLIRAADEIGMAVIVSFFYADQAVRLENRKAVRNAVITASRFLRDGAYSNVIIEVANEQDLQSFINNHPLIAEPDGMAMLMELARKESGGMLVGCSGSGGSVHREIAEASDVVLIHGNGQSRQKYYNLINTARDFAPGKPIICNEDSQAIGQLAVAAATHTSWGYYNNMTKQEPPTRWGVLPGEDTFFALRMAEAIGLDITPPAVEDQVYLCGFEPEMEYRAERWIRLASLHPETINYVEFFRNGELYSICYDEPFSVHFLSNWRQGSVSIDPAGEAWFARIHFVLGEILEKRANI